MSGSLAPDRAPSSSGPVGTKAAREPGTELGLLVMAVIWGINFPFIKVALEDLSPLAFNALRFPLAAVFLYVVLRRRGPIPRPRASDWPVLIGLGLAGNVIYQMFFIFGLAFTRAGNASLLLATTPVWTTLLSGFLGHERPTAIVWVGIAGSLVGMTLVVVGGSAGVGLEGATLRGDLLVICASLVWSMYTVGARSLIHRYGSVAVTAWTLWVGTAVLVLIGAPDLLRTPIGSVTPMAWLSVIYAGVLAVGLAYVLWNYGVRKLGSSRTAIYGNLVPVVALVAAWAWLAEVPTELQLVGAVVVIVSVYLTRHGHRDMVVMALE